MTQSLRVNYISGRLHVILSENKTFNVKSIAQKMIRSIGARRHVDPKMSEDCRIPLINQVYNALVSAVNNFPFDNG